MLTFVTYKSIINDLANKVFAGKLFVVILNPINKTDSI